MANDPQKSTDVSKIKNWQQVLAIAIPTLSTIASFIIKPETAIYITFIALALIALMFYIVYRGSKTQIEDAKNKIDAAITLGCATGLRKYRDNLQSRINNDPDCFEKIITELGIAIDAYQSL